MIQLLATSPLLGALLPQDETNPALALMLIAFVVVVMGFGLILARRYKRCPSNRILVIYGKTGAGRTSRCMHGGGAFVWPLIQNYDFLALDPLQIEIDLVGALSAENIRVNVPSVFTVAVGTDEGTMNNAAVRLLGLKTSEVTKQAEDIIFGQLRQVLAGMPITDINRDRDAFLDSVQSSLEPELRKIGLVLINVNIKDITDESGYIEAIGRKAAATAIKQAEVDVAEQNKKGAIGVAQAERQRAVEVALADKDKEIGTKDAEREQEVRVAELARDQAVGEQTAQFEQEARVRDSERAMRIQVADANAKAVAGENEAKAQVAQVNAELKMKEAEAYQRGETRHVEAQAAVKQAQYLAQAMAAEAEAKKIEAEKRAELEASAKAAKAQTIVDAQASAERMRIEAEGDAAAIFARLDAEARGNYEILAKKGQGLREIVESCGGSQAAFQLLMLEQMEALSANAAQAISNIKFDKVIVWEGGDKNGDGTGSTAGFLKSLAGSLPPMMQIMRDIGGVEMPEYFGRLMEDGVVIKPAAPPAAATDAEDAEAGNGEGVTEEVEELSPVATDDGPVADDGAPDGDLNNA